MLPHQKTRSIHAKPSQTGGFTLVEVMIGTVIFMIAMVGMLGTTLMAYRYTLISRYQERAANALITIVDQFQNSPIVDKSTGSPKTFFTETTGDTGNGMAWDSTKQCFVYPTTTVTDTIILPVNQTTAPLAIALRTVGDTDPLITANITRNVSKKTDPYATSGAATTSYMLQGTFTITYTFCGSQQITINALRTVTPTDLL